MKEKSYILFGLLVLFSAACTKNATISYSNQTAAPLYISVDGGNTETINTGMTSQAYSYKIPYSLVSSPGQEIAARVYGQYKFTETNMTTLTATTVVDIPADCGVIKVLNNYSPSQILAVYITPSSSSSWGNNLITTGLNTGYYYWWRAAADTWDIRIYFNSNGNFYTNRIIYGTPVVVNRVVTFTLSSTAVLSAATGGTATIPMSTGTGIPREKKEGGVISAKLEEITFH